MVLYSYYPLWNKYFPLFHFILCAVINTDATDFLLAGLDFSVLPVKCHARKYTQNVHTLFLSTVFTFSFSELITSFLHPGFDTRYEKAERENKQETAEESEAQRESLAQREEVALSE